MHFKWVDVVCVDDPNKVDPKKNTKRRDSPTLVGKMSIVDLHLNPVHEQVHVAGAGQCRGPPELVLILPTVLHLGRPMMCGAERFSAACH